MRSLADLLQADPFDSATVRAALHNLGFADSDSGNTRELSPAQRAEKLIDGLAKTPSERACLYPVLDHLLEAISRSADPMRGLINLVRLGEAMGDRVACYERLRQRPAVLSRLCRVLAFSQALADTLVRQPELLSLLETESRPRSRPQLRAEALAALEGASSTEARLEALRRFRRRQTLRIGLQDLERPTWSDAAEFSVVVHQISDLAQVCVAAALELMGHDLGCANNFVVLAMGKLGARELNYSSDIDLIFIGDGPADPMNRLGQALLKALSDSGTEGGLFRVDMRLRPDGKSGALVTPFGYALSYYESYAAPWEWQALIKCRAIAGDARLARRFRHFTREITWARRPDDGHLRDILEMKRRSEATAEGRDTENVKQGPGGIRDAEWVVQQLQMMVGPQHRRARVAATLPALEALRSLNALTHLEARDLGSGYLFLRVLEHRLQLLDERAVRTLPEAEADLAALARRMGTHWRGAAAARWLTEEHARHRADVRGLCERLFWGWREVAPTHEIGEQEGGAPSRRPAGPTAPLEAVGVPDDTGTTSPELSPDSRQRLMRLAEGTPSHPLPAPLARQVRAALPGVLKFLDHAANPERAVANLERLCEAAGSRLSLLRALGEAPELARAVLAILGGSEMLTDTLIRYPELLDLAAQRSALALPRSWEQARAECRAYCLTFADRGAALRRWKQRELLRIGLRDLALDAPPQEITAEIANLAQACLQLASDECGALLRPASEQLAFVTIGMGKLGGGEMHYASDADVSFAYTPLTGDRGADIATAWARNLTRILSDPTADGVCFAVDARLRPNGRNGALAPSIAAYEEYFEEPSGGIAVWERQALTRARVVAGDAATAARFMALIRHVAFPDEWRPEWGEELRHIKVRVENERAARGQANEAIFDVKLGHGALADIEFCAQWLALKHGAAAPQLQTPNTVRQITAAQQAGLLDPAEATVLRDAYDFLRRVELRLQVTQEHPPKAVRRDSPQFAAWARAVYPDRPQDGAAIAFEEQWRLHTDRVRPIMERVREAL